MHRRLSILAVRPRQQLLSCILKQSLMVRVGYLCFLRVRGQCINTCKNTPQLDGGWSQHKYTKPNQPKSVVHNHKDYHRSIRDAILVSLHIRVFVVRIPAYLVLFTEQQVLPIVFPEFCTPTQVQVSNGWEEAVLL